MKSMKIKQLIVLLSLVCLLINGNLLKEKKKKQLNENTNIYEKELENRKMKIIHEGQEAPSLNGIEPQLPNYKAQTNYGGKNEAIIVNDKNMSIDNYNGYTPSEGIPYSS